MQKVALIKDSFVGTIDTSNTKQPLFVQLYNNDDSIKSFDDSSYSNEDEDNLSLLDMSIQGEVAEKKEVKKRQRLTHLTVEEKILRRKLKNRMAAQSARDRKKLRMEELEQELVQLKAQNEKLKNENQILKDNAKLLIEENRKLLKYKTDSLTKEQESKQRLNNNSIPKLEQISESSVIGPRLKRKIDALTSVEVVSDESAVFFKPVSQPQKQQLQQMFQKFICILILYTMNLISKETSLLNQKKINIYKQQQQQHRNQSRLLTTRTKTTTFNCDENNKVKSNFAESVKVVKILPATSRHAIDGKNNSSNQMQPGTQVVSKSDIPRNEEQFERVQTNDICFINDEFNEKQSLDSISNINCSSFCFDDDLLDELLKTNIIQSDNNKCPTSISDKIDYSIMKLENSVKSDSLGLPKPELEHEGLDLSVDFDYDSINQIMNEFFTSVNGTESTTNQATKTNLIDFDINTDVLVKRFDPMIGNGVFDIMI